MKSFISLIGLIITFSVSAQAPAGDDFWLQVHLDRAQFSVGEIDGVAGSNTRKALKAFQVEFSLAVTGELDDVTRRALDDGRPTVVKHELTAEDVEGPFIDRVPGTMLGKSKLKRVGYANVLEKLGERFQASPNLLKTMNPEATFVAGETINVPNAGRPSADLLPNVTKIVVTKSDNSLRLYNEAGKLLAYYPTTLGSPQSPPPYGTWKVSAVVPDPLYNYDPERFVSPGTPTKVTIQPGPNNPVGVMWIALSAKHYGIHGSPDPSKISKQQSNGCIRLTNWDALEVAKVIGPGVQVVVQE